MKYRLFILLFLIFQFSNAQFTNTEVVAKIKTERIDDIVSITAEATNTTEVYKSLKYTFSVFRTDPSKNVSKNNQEGRFTLEANEQKILSTTSIGIDESDKIVVLLLIYEEETIVGKDRLAFNEESEKDTSEVEESSNDGIELKGIVIEETKTKPGKDFYEFFYNSYTLNRINGSKIVGVYEKLSFGRSTIIQVKIEDKLIHEFLGKPDIEYLERMSKLAIRRVYKYFKDLKNQKNDIFQY
ncbi:curli-like amyloid fiber formation chaperone CsgH [Aquimarina sp. 2201CG14-23]|uniref:curli-like amyloid fiber formation chaperone CsgH n=1 Tax=Aquimarina mycalae TaxID=3040073 RepID=UPI002477EA8F|nr:curli-like amyloid fiber formation chaperone CsgH [Aquimarina sp. 2201CG14-23]MDH7444629.1 curli-like amyloid fiber formation chaperone CsgH [Aquimarina sp. 2201CG14-23]